MNKKKDAKGYGYKSVNQGRERQRGKSGSKQEQIEGKKEASEKREGGIWRKG